MSFNENFKYGREFWPWKMLYLTIKNRGGNYAKR